MVDSTLRSLRAIAVVFWSRFQKMKGQRKLRLWTWCVQSDSFGFRIILTNKPVTRRGILSTVSSIYDPLGFIAPLTLVAKKILQELCRSKSLGWDDDVPEEYRNQRIKWRNELPMLELFHVDRCLKPRDFGPIVSRQLHMFSDASTVGYGCFG